MLDAHIAYSCSGAEEAVEAAAWYEKERSGLGVDFHNALEAALDVLEQDIVPLTSMPGVSGARGVESLEFEWVSLFNLTHAGA